MSTGWERGLLFARHKGGNLPGAWHDVRRTSGGQIMMMCGATLDTWYAETTSKALDKREARCRKCEEVQR